MHLVRIALIGVAMAAGMAGCDDEQSEEEWCEGGGGEEGEEAGLRLAPGAVHDEVRKDTRTILAFDEYDNEFRGTVENLSSTTLDDVRVEVHLSNGTELGPTPRKDLGPGAIMKVRLESTEAPFLCWTAHAEVGGEEEHGHGEHE